MIIEGVPVPGSGKTRIAIARRLTITDSHVDNKKSVEVYGHNRYRYLFSTTGVQDVKLDCISHSQIHHSVIVVPDLHEQSIRFSTKTAIRDVPDNINYRKLAFFFRLKGVQLTSMPGFTS